MDSNAVQQDIRTCALANCTSSLPFSRHSTFFLDHRVVDVYGKLRAALENSGTGIGALDTFIAAQALSLGATLVTSNGKEFMRVPGLQVQDWR